MKDNDRHSAAAVPAIDRLLEIMARLRDPEGGCPWDREQSFATIAPYTIEEAYEVADAIARGDMAGLRDELGDLLFQVVFYAEMAREAGEFSFEDIAQGISDKMERRHPHVFGDTVIASESEQNRAWERHKADERAARAAAEGRAPSVLDGVAHALPALMRAYKLQRRAAREGFDWDRIEPVFGKIEEEIAEIRDALAGDAGRDAVAEEMGDLLFACVNLARHLKIDPEVALRRGNDKFERRFRRVEALLAARGKSPAGSSLAEMDAMWDQVKIIENAKKVE
jgi:MazG family protein